VANTIFGSSLRCFSVDWEDALRCSSACVGHVGKGDNFHFPPSRLRCLRDCIGITSGLSEVNPLSASPKWKGSDENRPVNRWQVKEREGSKVDIFDGSWVQYVLANYGYAAIFIVVMLESAGVPLPGETILVSAAAFSGHRHSLDIRYVIAAAAGGAIVGDNIGFWVGREFGTSLLSRWGYVIGLDERKRKLGQYLFARHGGKIVFFGRFVALLRAFAALLAGANGLSPLRFFVFNAAGGIVWATVFGVGGYVVGEGIRRIAGPFGWVVLIAATIFAVLLWRYYKKHEERFLDEAEAAAGEMLEQQHKSAPDGWPQT
jgi:membrane protein DedA with SNARE-associated domain